MSYDFTPNVEFISPDVIPLPRIVPILRHSRPDCVIPVVTKLIESGIKAIELTFTIPGVTDLLRKLTDDVGKDIRLGVGTVMTLAQANEAADAGAKFLMSPSFVGSVAAVARDRFIPYYPGSLTPTEIMTAHNSGAAGVKIFPASIFGTTYLRHMLAVMPQIPLIATGGIEIDQAMSYLSAGARSVGMGGPLIQDSLDGGDLLALAQRARHLLELTMLRNDTAQ